MTKPLITIEIDADEITEALSAIQGRFRDMTPAFKNIGEYMVREREKLFKEERSPAGVPWKKLSPAYAKRKKNKKILTLMNHLRRTVYAAGEDQVVISPDKTSSEYAAIHHFGGRAGRGKKALIPARPHLGVSEENRREFVEIIRDHLLKAIS